MNHLAYLAAKISRSEQPFAQRSCQEQELFQELRGKRVALVGNARALTQSTHGAAIDSADVVVRINSAPRPSALSHGTRTDWLALAVRQSEEQLAALGNPRVLWMSPKLKRITWAAVRRPGFHRYDQMRYLSQRAQLGDGPTTGFMTIGLLADSPLAKLDLYGFDFFASLSLSSPKTRAEVGHNFEGEAELVHALCREDDRISLIR